MRIAVVGGGRMGATHAGVIARDPDCVLAAVVDPLNDRLARDHGAAHFQAHGAMVGSGGVDAVIVATPNDAHVPITLELLEAGLPVLLEKPVATSLAAARTLASGIERLGGRVLVGHHRRHHPAVAAAREAVRSGRIGDVVAVCGMWAARKDDAYFEPQWRRRAGAGVLLINLVHDLDLLRVLVGEVCAVQAVGGSRWRQLEVEDTVGLVLEFAGGAIATLVGSDAAVSPWGWDQSTHDDGTYPYHPMSTAYSIAGTSGALTVPGLVFFHHAAPPADWLHPLSADVLPTAPGDSYSRQLAHFVRVVRQAEEPLVSVADAVGTLALLDATAQAIRTGVRVVVQPWAQPPDEA